ncbi:hypothetical protein F2P79_021419 [Pimephales promelas]|nr:hypothetical protein F2P79_021419 [Pimephales promelas]
MGEWMFWILKSPTIATRSGKCVAALRKRLPVPDARDCPSPTVGLLNPRGLMLVHGEHDPVRRDRTDHWPLHASEKGRYKMPECRVIVRSKCSKCAVYCFTAKRNCFVDFHKA